MRILTASLLVLSVLAIGACGDDEEDGTTPAQGGSAGTSQEGGVGGAAGSTAGAAGEAGAAGSTAGAAGEAGAAGAAGAAAVDACKNADDAAKMQATYGDGGTASDVATACAMGCLSDTSKIKECVADCVKTETGMSQGCSLCFGGIIACTANKCMGPCVASPGSAECTKCQCDNQCYSEFATCSGVPGDQCTP